MRILVVKRDKLGDLLLTTPVLAHLAAARPEVELHLLANDYNAWVVAGHPALARVWVYPRVKHGGRVRIGGTPAEGGGGGRVRGCVGRLGCRRGSGSSGSSFLRCVSSRSTSSGCRSDRKSVV